MDKTENTAKTAELLRQLTMHIDHEFRRMPWHKSYLGLNGTYWNILTYLYLNEDALPNKGTCRKQLGDISQNTSDSHLDQLISSGVLIAKVHPHDSRAKAIALSPEARSELDKFFEKITIDIQID